MYNTAKIEKIKARIQDDIYKLIDSYTEEINKAIESQLPKNHKLYSLIDSIHCENPKGYHVGDKFSSDILSMIYTDCFDTSINIKSINID